MSIYLNKCAICENQFDNLKSLINHVRHSHNMRSKTYYDKYILCQDENICPNLCGKNTNFISLNKGYKKYCSYCSRSVGAKNMRKRLKNDAEKFKKFSQKLSMKQTEIWENRRNTGTAEIIFEKVKVETKKAFSGMTKIERSEKFGWLNRLEGKEREIAIAKITVPLFDFWENEENEENRRLVVQKRRKTMLNKLPCERKEITKKVFMSRYNMSIEQVEKWQSDKTSKEKYYNAVREVTEISYNYCKHIIDPNNLRGVTEGKIYHLDHIYSIMQGFIENICPTIIGHACNLQILTDKENISKSANSWISITELKENIEQFEINNKNTWIGKLLNGV